jgi:hypothetical protein
MLLASKWFRQLRSRTDADKRERTFDAKRFLTRFEFLRNPFEMRRGQSGNLGERLAQAFDLPQLHVAPADR